MHLGRTKNILIIVLALANLTLGGLLGWRLWEGARARAESNRQVIKLLAERGVSVSHLPDAQLCVTALLIDRSYDAETQAVGALIGGADRTPRGGGIIDYKNGAGSAQFQAGGHFEIKLENAALPDGAEYLTSEGERELRSVSVKAMRDMGLHGVSEEAVITQDADTTTVTFGQTIQGFPIFNARAELKYNPDSLSLVSGWWCFGIPRPENAVLCKSAGAALLQFTAGLGEPLEVLDVQLGYRLSPHPPDAARLSPEWRVICDGREIYLDAFTAAPTAE